MRGLLAFVPLVSAEICQDFCIQQLGADPCSRGSYRKGDLCHSLFWTDETRTSICVFSGRGDCSERFPVLYSDASSRLILTSASPQTTRTSIPTTVGPVATADSPSPSHDTAVVSANSSSDALDNVVVLDMSFDRSEANQRAYVRSSFYHEGRRLEYNAVFETASSVSTAVAATDAGYHINLDVFRYRPRSLLLSGPSGIHEVSSTGNVAEIIRLFSGSEQFTFEEPHLELLTSTRYAMPSVSIGASVETPFATTAGAFAIVPSHRDAADHFSNWKLLIGRNVSTRAQAYCSEEGGSRPMQWFNLLAPADSWSIPGYMSVSAPGEAPIFADDITMSFTTGGSDVVEVSQVIMDSVIAQIQSFGPRQVRVRNPFFTDQMFSNCNRENLLPHRDSMIRLNIQAISATAAGGDEPITLIVDPLDHVDFNHGNSCILKWKVTRGISRNQVAFGPAYLRRIVSVFDKTNTRIGLCERGNTTTTH